MMNESQKVDYAYHEDRLTLLLAQRDALPKDSPQMAVLDSEITTINDLVRSYRILKALE
jgi:hypothetical protein